MEAVLEFICISVRVVKKKQQGGQLHWRPEGDEGMTFGRGTFGCILRL